MLIIARIEHFQIPLLYVCIQMMDVQGYFQAIHWLLSLLFFSFQLNKSYMDVNREREKVLDMMCATYAYLYLSFEEKRSYWISDWTDRNNERKKKKILSWIDNIFHWNNLCYLCFVCIPPLLSFSLMQATHWTQETERERVWLPYEKFFLFLYQMIDEMTGKC